MTTFIHPSKKGGVKVDWSALSSDEEKQEIVDAFRAKLAERRVQFVGRFDPDKEEAKIPQVVRDWEEERLEALDHQPALEFVHPTEGTRFPDWNKLSRAARVVVVEGFKHYGTDPPTFIQEWAKQNSDKDLHRMDKELEAFVPWEKEIEEYRTLWQESNLGCIRVLTKQIKLIEQMLTQKDNVMIGRKHFYQLMIRCNESYSQALICESMVALRESRLSEMTKRAHGESMLELQVRHEEETKQLNESWDRTLKEFASVADKRTRPIESSTKEVTALRRKVMGMIHDFRRSESLPNIGVNHYVGSPEDFVPPRAFALTNKEVGIIETCVLPLLQDAAKKHPKGIMTSEGKLEKLVQYFLASQLDTKDHTRRCDILRLNHLLQRYSIPAPSAYVEHVAWLGDITANYEEFFTKMASDINAQNKRYAAELGAEEAAKLALKARAERAVAAEETPPPPNPTEAAPSSSSSEVSSLPLDEQKETVVSFAS